MPKKLGDLTLYTVEELSKLLDIQETTIRKYLRDGKLRGRKLAARWYVSEESLAEYFREAEPDNRPEKA
jgi:excisionase family DNA binding protein